MSRQIINLAVRCLERNVALFDAVPQAGVVGAMCHCPSQKAYIGGPAIHAARKEVSKAPSWQLSRLCESRRSMFIQTQPTPNPSSLMFLPGKTVMEKGSKDFPNAREAMTSPLAISLFRIDGVTGVFFGSNFVTVKKKDDLEWSLLKPDIYAAIMDHFASEKALFADEFSASPSDTAINEHDSEVVAMIKELLETRIKPAVAEDGGDVLFMDFEEETGRVTLKMQGACSGCPSSSVTLKSGIEQMMRHYIPEVKEVVEAEPDEGEQEGLKAFNKMEQHLSN